MTGDPIIVTCHTAAAEAILAAAAAAGPHETGGILLGWWADTGIVIAHAIEVIDPRATGQSWCRSEDTAQPALERALTRLNDPPLGYVGDWHTHPAPCPTSGADLLAISCASRQYPNPIALLVHQPPDTITIHVAHGRLQPAAIDTTIPGTRDDPALPRCRRPR